MAGNHLIRLFAAALYLRPSSKEPRERGAPLGLDAVLQHSDVALPLVQRHHVHQASVRAHHSGVDGRLADAGTLRHKREKMLKHHREGRKSSRTCQVLKGKKKIFVKGPRSTRVSGTLTRTDTSMCVTA